MARFAIRNDLSFTRYVKVSYKYFLPSGKVDGVKITIRKNSTFITITQYYCVICNDLLHLLRNGRLEADKQSLTWLNRYNT